MTVKHKAKNKEKFLYCLNEHIKETVEGSSRGFFANQIIGSLGGFFEEYAANSSKASLSGIFKIGTEKANQSKEKEVREEKISRTNDIEEGFLEIDYDERDRIDKANETVTFIKFILVVVGVIIFILGLVSLAAFNIKSDTEGRRARMLLKQVDSGLQDIATKVINETAKLATNAFNKN